MGMPIVSRRGKTLGVLKAEFPSCFDDTDYFGNDDVEFFTDCSKVVSEYLEDMTEVLSVNYLKDSKSNSGKCFRSIMEILRTKLIKDEEASEFWSSLCEYLETNKEELRIEGIQIFRNVPNSIRRELEIGIMDAVRKLPQKLVDIIGFLLKEALNDI